MRTGIPLDEEKTWRKISDRLARASRLLELCQLDLMLRLEITTGKPADRLNEAEESLRGLSYMFMPQSEWTGGPPELNNYKVKKPHIAR